ncbi:MULTISPECIES: hypothetical protein [Pseudomonas]|jgi:hypothetical protein|nr:MULTISPECIES: hypothetical protein [unclassified Pseudomonas]
MGSDITVPVIIGLPISLSLILKAFMAVTPESVPNNLQPVGLKA